MTKKTHSATPEDVLDRISEVVKDKYSQKAYDYSPVSIMGGLPGLGLFAAYYHDFTGESFFQDMYLNIIEECIDYISSGIRIPDTFAGGLAGIGWLIHHFMEKGWITHDSDILAQFDTHLKGRSFYYFDEGNYDFLHGGLGFGLYWLGREEGEAEVARIIDRLDQISIKNGDNIYWMNYRPIVNIGLEEPQIEEVNFGLSHGMTSILVFLTKAYAKGIKKEKCRKIINGMTNFIKPYAFADPKISIFPATLNQSDEGLTMGEPSRLAWCYGDLSMAYSFLRTGHLLHDEKLVDFAINLAVHTTTRREENETYLFEENFCHGYFGVAHIYDKLYAYHTDHTFREASDFWFTKGLSGINTSNPIEDFKHRFGETMESSDSLLMGIAGIGLSLIDKIKSAQLIENNWDSCLLLS